MILADFHTHTSFSTDSKAAPETMIEAAIAKGLKHYCITDHMDAYYPGKEGEFVFNPVHYFEALRELQARYSDRIQLRIGVELGLRDEADLTDKVRAEYQALLAAYPFDFVIGSTHCLQHTDPYYPPYWETRSPEDSVLNYFEACLANVTDYDCFQVFGHLDYILRYMPAGASVPESRYSELMQEILRTLIARGKGIEVNTTCLVKGFPAPHPGIFALKEYLALGGEILTIGSDAHAPENVAAGFHRTCDLLQSLGYRYYTTFTRQIPEFHRL